MKLFLRTNDVDTLRAVRKAATGRLLAGVVTDITNQTKLKALAEVAKICVTPVRHLDSDEIVRQSASLKEFRENIIPAITFGRTTLQAINWLSEHRYQTFVVGISTGAQGLFAAQAGATYVATSDDEVLGACIESVGYYGGGIEVPYGEGWGTAIVRMSSKKGGVYNAIEQGADACVVSPKVFWRLMDSTAVTETE